MRQLSAENAAKIRERVKIAKQKEMEKLKKRIMDAIVQRNHLTHSGVISPVPVDSSALVRIYLLIDSRKINRTTSLSKICIMFDITRFSA